MNSEKQDIELRSEEFSEILVAIRLHFACGETALAGHRPHLLGLPRKIGRGVSPRETTRCGSVSYTHLDVYKRQRCCSPCAGQPASDQRDVEHFRL